jgi:hypothetical protein
MPSATITCPSGLTGEIRSPKVRELEAFIERVKRSFSEAHTELLQACWLKTLDPAIYDGGTFRWSKALVGDRLDAWRQMRILAFGPELDFRFQCDSMTCRDVNPAMQGWSARLDQLTIKDLPEASKELFRAGNRFEATVAGQKVWFRLLTGDMEADIEHRSRGKRRKLAEAMAERLVEVEGVGSKPRDIAEWIRDLETTDLAQLGQNIDAADCGIDLGIEVQCEHCSRVVKLDIPFVENWIQTAKKRVESI